MDTPRQIDALLKQSYFAEAEKLCRQHISENPLDAQSTFVLAAILLKKQAPQEALQFAEQAVKLDPNELRYSQLLAKLYLDFSIFELAFPLIRKVLKMSPLSHEANRLMADYLLKVGKGSTALPYFERALQSSLHGQAKAHTRLQIAECLTALGKSEDAIGLLDSLMDEPEVGIEATINRASLEKAGPDSAVGKRILRQLEQVTLKVPDRADYLLSLGRLHENNKDYDKAFDCWSQSRALLGMKVFPRQNLPAIVDGLTSFFSKDLLDQLRPYGHPSSVPVFIVGMPRSGTTLNEQIIAAHSQAHGVGELNRFALLQDGFLRQYANSVQREELLANAKKGELLARAGENLKVLTALSPQGVLRIVEKTPMNYRAIGYLLACFPYAKIIHCRRHPADNFISAFQNRMSQFHDYSYNQSAFATTYLEQERLMAHWKTARPENIFEMQYEGLVENPEGKIKQMLAFLNLPWQDNIMQFFEREATVNTFSRQQVRVAINSSSVNRWRHFGKHLDILFQRLENAGFEYNHASSQ